MRVSRLQPNRGLRKPNFENYEPILEEPRMLDVKELRAHVTECLAPVGENVQRSKGLFDNHNHLHIHPSDHNRYGVNWFCNDKGTLWRYGDLWDLEAYYKYTAPDTKLYNCSLAFASLEITAMCDGNDKLYILYELQKGDQSGSQDSDESDDFHYKVSTATIDPGILMDARYFESQELLKIVECCIVDEHENFQVKIVVLTYQLNIKLEIPEELRLLHRQEFIVDGVVDYAYLAFSGFFINIMSEAKPRLTFDSLSPEYCWSQDAVIIKIWLKIPETYCNALPYVVITEHKITVRFMKTIILEGDWQHSLDPDFSTWRIQNNIMKLTITKAASNQDWTQLILGDNSGRYIPQGVPTDEVSSRFSQFFYGGERCEHSIHEIDEQQLDSLHLNGNEMMLRRIHLDSYITTHLIILDADDRFLFTHHYLNRQIMFIKQDHDVCIWSMKEDGDDFNAVHETTYPDLGDILATIENKRLFVSPPDWSYIAIVGSSRYVYIYDKPARKKKVGKMRTIDLGENEMPIMGAVATKIHLFILTQNKVYKIAI